ncbi:MAG: NBR1-Ig-like domain-containing protein, partial [Thermoflexales bacterium]|nr:NBR1-Ig-like domain-containing protein [Thermoflexales bacterium]
AAGEPVLFTVSAAASAGVARIEIQLDGVSVATRTFDPSERTLTTQIPYQPQVQGRLAFQVVAVDARGVSSAPFNLSVIYGQIPTPTPNPAVVTTIVVGAGGCRQAAVFLQDVTVPDGTAFRAGTPFTKTWRMRNASSCDWGFGYTLVHESDSLFSPVSRVPVSPTPSNANVDISVPMVAPAQPGIYTSTWRLQDPQGQWFGNRVFVVIRVLPSN